VILALYREKGTSFLEELNGIFAFALYDAAENSFMIARDHMGIIPLYMGWDEWGSFYVSSELKTLSGVCNKIQEFPPGHYLSGKDGKLVKWYSREWTEYENVKDNVTDIPALRKALEEAVHRQLMSDVPYGVLLSGGLDSSIISAIAKKYAARRIETEDIKDAWWPQLHSFAVGLKDSTDLVAARKVADHLGTVHHEVHFTIEEGVDALRDVIYHIETYDVTTIRASTPMYLLARVIKSMGVKMVLTGEGSDELFGGYLYFHKAPDPKAFHEETVRKLSKLHLYDCLRANKSLAAWGVEGRVPFLDKEFMDVAMRINPKDKMAGNGRIEKWVLRKAFEDYLPAEVAWRQKEQFSDGVGYSWIDTLKQMTSEAVSDEQLKNAAFRFPVNTPRSKEEYYYRSIFNDLFPGDEAARCVPSEPSVACSTAIALEWDEAFKKMNDPSGRAVMSVHGQPN
jgi:asparagine synthase (glutamine-hydrolysing)